MSVDPRADPSADPSAEPSAEPSADPSADPTAASAGEPLGGPWLDRRRLLGGLAFGAGAAAVLGGCTQPGRPGATTAPAPVLPLPQTPTAAALGAGTPEVVLFGDPAMDFQAGFGLGGNGTNSVAGQVASAAAQARSGPEGATIQTFVDAFVAMGNRLSEQAAEARRGRHRLTARNRYMRAAQYYGQALYFILGTDTPDAEAAVYRTMDDAWRNAAWLMPTKFEPIEIPYGTTTLPGWFLPAGDDISPRATVILNNGSDGQHVDLWAWGAAAALERGYNVVLFDGPGQGEMLFEREVPLRPDWEQVITPVVDWLLERPDTDPERIVCIGWSEGGELVARAAAFEPRLAAVVCDPGVVDAWLAFPDFLRAVADDGTPEQVNQIWNTAIVPGATPEQQFTLKKRLELYSTEALRQARAGQVPSDWAGLSATIRRFNVRDVAPLIEVPTLVVDYELEQFYPGQARELYDLLTTETKELITLGVADGAMYHCAPYAPAVRNEAIFDWLQRLFRRRRDQQ